MRDPNATVVDPNPDWSPDEKEATMALMQRVMQNSKGIAATVVVRVFEDGTVRTAGGTKTLRDAALVEISEVARLAIQELARVRLGPANPCGCPTCVARRSQSFGGPKAQA